MVDNPELAGDGAPETKVTVADAAAYIYELSREMVAMAERHRLSRVAAALELARGLAAEALAEAAIHSRSGKAAPADAA